MNIDLYCVIRSIVDTVMGELTEPRPNQALLISFNLRATSNDGMRSGKTVDFLFNRKATGFGFRTTHTFARYCNGVYDNINQPWEHLSSHDSCWIDAVQSHLHTIEMEMMDELRAKYSDIHWYNSFNMHDPFWRWVDVEVKYDPTDYHNYKRVIKVKP